MRVLIWGRLTPFSASSNGVVSGPRARPIDSMWRFGRDFRHSTSGEKVVILSHMKYTVMNLHRARISPEPRIQEGVEVLHTGSHIFVRAKSVFDCVEVAREGLFWTLPG